ncbi:MAG: nicotinate-nucleotide adenylyltransferase [Lachnospiraceae bacterium]|nr:nicotinate-nucleotide adenylyltransferase [Lachnospiraceae bacterium]
MKVGIFGGTFDPIHEGHIKLAMKAKEQYLLDKVFFMPTPTPPHKDTKRITSYEERCRMIRLAMEGMEGLYLSEFENQRTGTSYTADTLTAIKKMHPEYELYFILGADSLDYLEEWYRPEVIFSCASIICAPRYPFSKEEDIKKADYLRDKYHARIYFIEMESVNVSSNELREKLSYGDADNRLVKEMLSEKVKDYIFKHKLYRSQSMNQQVYEIAKDLKKRLKTKRYIHTIGVMHTAANLAMRYNPELMELAMLAGVLHDCAKYQTGDKLLEECIKYNLSVSEVEKRNPSLLHARVGAYYAQNRYKVTDENVLSAIFYHTTGRACMSLLEQIVFLADYIEPSRKMIPGLMDVRKYAFTDIDKATAICLKNTLYYIEEKDTQELSMIDKSTREAYEYYKKYL